MRKLHLQMQMSIDGFVATGPNDEQKWVTWAWAADSLTDFIKLVLLPPAGVPVD